MELREMRAAANANSGELGGICIGSSAESGVQRMPTKADLFMEQLNATNAKKVALLLVLGFVLYHGLLNWNYGALSILFGLSEIVKYRLISYFLGSDSCQWLLSKGRFKGDNEWQPYGCMMHKYTYT